MNAVIKPQNKPLSGDIEVAADKSITHRAIIFSALAHGTSRVANFLNAADTGSTCKCITQLGIRIEQEKDSLIIHGQGLEGLKASATGLDCGNSGTTMRLLTGLLAGQPFDSRLNGDDSLARRPMKRVITPLELMGAEIESVNNGFPPLQIKGRSLSGVTYQLPMASAQVKSAIILAGLNAAGPTAIIEPVKSRDHSERMLASMGARISTAEHTITVDRGGELTPVDWKVPGDISSAAFFMVAASIIPGSRLRIRNVGLNPTRSGIIEVLQAMQAGLKIENRHINGGEPVGDIIVNSTQLKGVMVEGDLIPRLVDEIPVLAVAMALAEGESVVRDAGELRVKETDRIKVICSELAKMGVAIEELNDGFVINGRNGLLKGAEVDSCGDHRMAMSLAIAGLCGDGETIIQQAEAVNISFPDFWNLLHQVTR